jgi:3-deoxy-D-manno-octulosonic-acid transferase
MSILLDIAYGLAILLSSPLWLIRMIRHGRYTRDWAQRLGKAPLRHHLQPVIWIHGVSLGEINTARFLVNELHAQLPDFRIIISATTQTGIDRARELFAPGHAVFRWPMDFSLVVRRTLNRARPSLVILMEGEAWPNFLAACNRRDIPAAIVNGRMSPDKGYPRYRLIKPIARRLFNRLAAIGVQDETYAECFRSLGTDPQKIHVTGMMKFDAMEISDHIAGQDDLAQAMGIDADAPLWVAGGTGPGEEQLLLDAWSILRKHCPALQLALVPRKPERFEEVARLIESRGMFARRRSECTDPSRPPAAAQQPVVLLGDTMGELRCFYALADVVFVGRSLVPAGGSDMIEPAALARPTCFGPHTYNFPQADALARNGCVRVANLDALIDQLRAWLADPTSAAAAGQAAQQYVRSQQGATKRNVEMLCALLGRRPALTAGDIATDLIEQEA